MESKNTFQKDCLLKLINSCLINKKFYEKMYYGAYTHPFKEEGIVDRGAGQCVIKYISIQRAGDNDEYNKLVDSEEYEKITKDNFVNVKKEFHHGLEIHFTDEPKISIYLMSKGDRKILEEYYISEKVVRRKNLWNTLFGGRVAHKNVATENKIRFTKEELTNTYYYTIQSGSITEEITIEEFNELYEKFKTNKKSFDDEIAEEQKRKDLDKIIERVHKYN